MSNEITEVTVQTNQVTITSSLITAMSFNNFVDATPGQQPQIPPTVANNKGTWTITFKCGRKNSTGVATNFNKAVTGTDTVGSAASHEYAPVGGGGTPDELNFCFGMNVTLTVGSSTVQTVLYFGQGSTDLSQNNWWIGGNCIINLNNNPLLVLISNNNIVEVLGLSGSTSSFNLAPANTLAVRTAAS